MPRSLVLAAAVAAALTAVGCGSAPLAQAPPSASQSQPGAEQLAAGGSPATDSEQAAGSQQATSGQAGSDAGAAQARGSRQGGGGDGSASQEGAAQGDAAQSDAGAAESSELQASALESGAALLVDTSQPGLPSASGASIDDVLRLGALGTWIDAPGLLAISLPATEQCWPTAMAPVVESPTRLMVEFTGAAACGEPDSARTYTVQVPDGVDARAGLEVELQGLAYDFTLLLPAG